jgi:ubiquinone/menaquinone biosynthesis C-methylase UbiE
MIELSAHINKKIIDQKRLKLIHGSVTEIPIESNYLDLVTAFETVQFWPNIIIAFSEISRILKKGGSFLIINRYPKEDTKWWRMAKLKSSEDYKAQFKNAGFSDISIDLNYKKGWIILRGTKS